MQANFLSMLSKQTYSSYFSCLARLICCLSAGFTFCGPFADYPEDPNSMFMYKTLE